MKRCQEPFPHIKVNRANGYISPDLRENSQQSLRQSHDASFSYWSCFRPTNTYCGQGRGYPSGVQNPAKRSLQADYFFTPIQHREGVRKTGWAWTLSQLAKDILAELTRVCAKDGSIVWQVGNYVEDGEVFPLDIHFYPIFKSLGMQLRNRIVWHFDHGLHASNRFSGRYEVLLWFTKTKDYTFNLDDVRVPAKYPGKRHYKGNKVGQPSGNPLGKIPRITGAWFVMNGRRESLTFPTWNPTILKNYSPLPVPNRVDWKVCLGSDKRGRLGSWSLWRCGLYTCSCFEASKKGHDYWPR